MLSWLQHDDDVGALLARKRYRKAIQVLERRLQAEPGSVHLRQLYADALYYDGQIDQAIGVLLNLVDEFTQSGFVAKGIAVLKKIQRLEPEHPHLDRRLAELMGHGEPTPAARSAVRPVSPPRPGELPRADPHGKPPLSTSKVVLSDLWFEEAAEGRREFQWSPLFSDFSKEELASFFGNLRLLVKMPGSIIYTEGQTGESLFVLATGFVRLYRRQGDGSNEQVMLLRDGDLFGKSTVLEGGPRRHTTVAASECELLELDKETFDGIAQTHPEVSRSLRNMAAAQRAGTV